MELQSTQEEGAKLQRSKTELDIIVEAIRAEHQSALDSARDSLQHALRCGELLIKARKAIHNIGWHAWIKRNCKFSVRMAQNYVRLYERYKTTNAKRVSCDTVREALRAMAVRASRKEDEGKPKPKLQKMSIKLSIGMWQTLSNLLPDHAENPEQTAAIETLKSAILKQTPKAENAEAIPASPDCEHDQEKTARKHAA